MKNKYFIQKLRITFIVITGTLVSCEMNSDSINTTQQENTVEAVNMDIAISNMAIYNDSCQIAKLHSSGYLHHYDRVYHHHDSLYNYHHTIYHHGDSSHHKDWHHTTKHHHKHDSLNNDHHKKIH